MRDRPTLIQATYTIEIEDVKIIEQALTSDISNAEFSMTELNRVDGNVIMNGWKQWKAMEKAQTKARERFVRLLPEFHGLNDQFDDCDLDDISEYSAYLKE